MRCKRGTVYSMPYPIRKNITVHNIKWTVVNTLPSILVNFVDTCEEAMNTNECDRLGPGFLCDVCSIFLLFSQSAMWIMTRQHTQRLSTCCTCYIVDGLNCLMTLFNNFILLTLAIYTYLYMAHNFMLYRDVNRECAKKQIEVQKVSIAVENTHNLDPRPLCHLHIRQLQN